jgi:hypothetical protein
MYVDGFASRRGEKKVSSRSGSFLHNAARACPGTGSEKQVGQDLISI